MLIIVSFLSLLAYRKNDPIDDAIGEHFEIENLFLIRLIRETDHHIVPFLIRKLLNAGDDLGEEMMHDFGKNNPYCLCFLISKIQRQAVRLVVIVTGKRLNFLFQFNADFMAVFQSL